jgi:hypothetical protein
MGPHTRVFIPLLLAVLMLGGQVRAFDQVDVTAFYKSSPYVVDTVSSLEVKLTPEQITQIEGGSQLFYITIDAVESQGDYLISGLNPQTPQEPNSIPPKLTGPTTFRRPEIIIINKESKIWKQVVASGTIYLTLTNTGTQPLKVLISSILNEMIFTPVGSHYTVNVDNLNTLKIRTMIAKAEGSHHYKFLLDAVEHKKDMTITASAFKVENEQSAGTVFNFLKYDLRRVGYVIDNTDPNYCQAGSCPYTITVNMHNVKTLGIYIGEHINYEVVGGGEVSVGSRLIRSDT